MRFEIGKCYEHTTGVQIKVAGKINTTLYGKTLIAEQVGGLEYFIAVSGDTNSPSNWKEISEEKWMENFSR